MILKGSQRAGGSALAAHLLNDENDHVEVHELRGFMAQDLRGAFQEAYAVSKGTRCKQFLFSLSLNPPQTAPLPDAEFVAAADMAEQALGLTGQPRALVFHEKEGRRHAHCVWSRINIDTMTAVNLPHFKRKLREVSRELFIRHEWKMPLGLVNSQDRNPLNFTREDWQQSRRTGMDPRAVKALFQEVWAASDSRESFTKLLADRGFWLARGDRRSFVAVDFRGEVYSVARCTGQKTKAVGERLGDAQALPSVEQAKGLIASRMTAAVREHIRETERLQAARNQNTARIKRDLVGRQRETRRQLQDRQEARRIQETNARAARMRKGLFGLWDRVTGRHGKITRENEREAQEGLLRDQAEKQSLVRQQLAERRELQKTVTLGRETHTETMRLLYQDVAYYTRLRSEQRSAVQDQGRSESRENRHEHKRPDPHDLSADRTRKPTLRL